MEFGDLTTLITIAIAVFIFIRLRSVLGSRTGHQNPPNQSYSRNTPEQQPASDNVVTLPKRGKSNTAESGESEQYAEIDAIAEKGSNLNSELRELKDADSSFEPERFLQGSKMAYEMIVTAFADGDKKTLKNLLSREVYDGFVAALKQRQDEGLVVRSTFVGVDDAKIKSADIDRRQANVSVRFVSQIISATYDKDDNLVDGDDQQISEVIDLWTFSRDMRSRDPNWKLVATESES